MNEFPVCKILCLFVLEITYIVILIESLIFQFTILKCHFLLKFKIHKKMWIRLIWATRIKLFMSRNLKLCNFILGSSRFLKISIKLMNIFKPKKFDVSTLPDYSKKVRIHHPLGSSVRHRFLLNHDTNYQF